MGFFGFLKAPGKILNRLTGATNSHKAMNAVRDDMERARQNLAYANRVAQEQHGKLQKMLEELSGLGREQKSLHTDYKNRVKALEYDEQHLKGLGQHYTNALGGIEAKSAELLTRKKQLEERGAKLEGQAMPIEQKFREITEGAKQVDGKEIETLVGQFQQKYREVEGNRQKLKGLSKETSPELFTQHQKMVRGLDSLRKNTESTIKSKHTGLSETHQKIAVELNRLQKDYQNFETENKDIRRGEEKLQRKKQYIDTYQNLLEPELRKFSEEQEEFKKGAEGLKAFQGKLTDLEQRYTAKKGEAETLQKELSGADAYQNQLAERLRGLQGTLDFIGDRYQRQAGNASLLGGVGTAALALATLGTGSLGTVAAGLGSYATMGSMQKDIAENLKRWGAYQDVETQISSVSGNRIPDWNKTPLNRIDFKSRVFDTKIKMPEFGGLSQSIKHFEMPTLPTLAELPQLSAALGNIRSSEEIANLGILPGSTARSPNRSLLNPQLMQTLATLIRSKGRASNNNKKKGGASPLPRKKPTVGFGGLRYEY